MPVWAWILVAVVVLAAVAVAAWTMMSNRRTRTLRERFGPEYDRTVNESGKRRAGESELETRRKRREDLDIRPLAPASRERYAVSWRDAQARFVDAPAEAIREADALVLAVMQERGYPMEDFDQRSADISVDHPEVVQDYRAAHAISMASDHGKAGTEDLREAMVHYRALFERLLGSERGESMEREAR